METILEILEAQRPPASIAANVTHVDGVINPTVVAGTTVKTPMETVACCCLPVGDAPTICCSSHQLGAFFPHPALSAPTAAGNIGFPWGVPTFQTPLVDAANPEANQGQVPDDTPDTKDDYRGPRLHFQIPAQTAQAASASQFPTAPFGYPGVTSMPMLTYAPTNPALQHVETREPQAPNAQTGGQYPQTAHAAQTVPPGFSYPPQMWFTPNMPTQIAPETSRPASQVAPPTADPAKPADYQLLDDRIRAIEGFSVFGINARDLCLVPNVVLPQKFKDSLSGASLDWYMGLERTKIRSWRDLSEAFLKQYKYNLDMAPTRIQLQNPSQRSNETFKEYAQRWYEMASRVRPTLSDNELVDIFIGTLQGLYYEKMIDIFSTNFANMVNIEERVENGLKSGKITDTTAPQTINKRPHGGFTKKNEGEANAVTASAHPRYQFPMTPMLYYPYPYVTAAQHQQPPFQYQPQKGNQQPTPAQKNPNQQYNRDNKGQNHGQNNRGNFGNRPQFDKIPVPYAELVPYLIHVGAIVPRDLPTTSPPFNRSHNPNATCAFHAGHIGHSTEDCWALKKRIQELIDQEILSFSKEKTNMKTNPLPNHGGATINIMIEEENAEFILRAEEVKTLMSVVLQRLEQFGLLEGVHDDYAVCEFDPDNCDKLRGCVQELMDQGLVQFSKSRAAEEVAVIEPITIVYRKKKVEAPPKRIQPIHFRVPTPFPY
ncbi:uncharacterized protein LOC127136366 [Lathyrus oleraceus]|uniref:uncharacterized protein LOC127136366 n=1 Tax=Pisum sativum TaxID=3888 RepID=UPI0021D00BEE|nr:uncharacterized protein LOC127136366 [Pisum sativum]